jgi:hypothetical protein
MRRFLPFAIPLAPIGTRFVTEILSRSRSFLFLFPPIARFTALHVLELVFVGFRWILFVLERHSVLLDQDVKSL